MHCDRCPFYWERSTEDGTDWGCEQWGQEPPSEIELPDNKAGYGGCPILVNEGKKLSRLASIIEYANFYIPEEEMSEETKAEFDKAQKEAEAAFKEYDEYYPILMERLKKRAAKAWEKEKEKNDGLD